MHWADSSLSPPIEPAMTYPAVAQQVDVKRNTAPKAMPRKPRAIPASVAASGTSTNLANTVGMV